MRKLPFGGSSDGSISHSDKQTDSDASDIEDEEVLGYKHGKPIELPEIPHPPPLEQQAPQRHRYDDTDGNFKTGNKLRNDASKC